MLTKSKTVHTDTHSPADAYLAVSGDVRKLVLSHGAGMVLRRAAVDRACVAGRPKAAHELRQLASEIERGL